MSHIIQLTEDLLTGVPEMDEQHRVLVQLLNETYEMLRQRRRQEARERLVSGVVSYVDYHFRSEEAFQEAVGFPELDAHRKIHESFRKQALEWVAEARSGDEKALQELVAIIWAWLFRHIAVRDKAYGAFCAGCGKG